MKKRIALLLVSAICLSLLAACGTPGNAGTTTEPQITTQLPETDPAPVETTVPVTTEAPKVCNLTVTGANTAMTQFAQEEIMAAGQEHGVENAWTVSFDGIDETLSEQAYSISVSGNTISVKGGDDHGLMYGGLEVAEQILLYGAEGVKEASAAPYVLNRGYILNCPLDMRSPAYCTPGDAAQNNIETMWDLEYWYELFDSMARNRCNLFYLKNLNPFPSMIQVEGYEDVALNDVWKSNVPYDDACKGDMTNIVREEDWTNYTVVKTMTIDEKIAFWTEVMEYAADRGIRFGIRVGNIYTFAEQGKYGIDNNKDNPVTTDYFYKSIKTLLETYPLLAGMSVGAGENMGWTNDDSKNADYQWVHDVYGLAVNEVLAADPDRQFDLNLECSDELLEDLNANIIHAASYTSTHIYSCATPRLADATLAEDNDHIYSFTCRNEDVFNMRWGDPDFMRAFVKNMPGQDKLYSYVTGSDGYCYAKDYSFVDPELDGQLYLEKHWFNYFLMFRFLFEPDLSDARIADVFAHYYNDEPEVDTLLESTSVAGKIIPMVNRSYYMANGDYTWFAEGNWTHPTTYSYIDLKKWMKGDTTYVDGQTMSIEEYAIALANGEEPDAQGRMLPTEVAQNLKDLAAETLRLVEEIRKNNPKGENLTFTEKEFWQQVEDNEAMAYLGLFYAEKILGAIDIRLFNETKDEAYRASSVAHLEQSAAYCDTYAELINANYEPQRLARVGYFDVDIIAEGAHEDVEIAKTWKPRTIRPSYRPPDKSSHFDSEQSEETNEG